MKILFSTVMTAVILLSCRQADNKKDAIQEYYLNGVVNESASAEDHERFEAETKVPTVPSQAGYPLPVAPDWKKQIIRNASINMRVKDFTLAHASIYQSVENAGGYVAADAENQAGNHWRSEMTIRVPKDKFEWLLTRITAAGDSLLQKSITSDDVTAEYLDTKTRIAVREKVRDKYYEFMQKAKNIDEVLKVQKEIATMQEDIEAASGRVAYISHQAAFSTIQLSFYQPTEIVIKETPAPGFIQEAVISLKEGWQLVEWMVIGLIKIWPLWMLGILGGYLLQRRKRNSKIVTSHKKQV